MFRPRLIWTVVCILVLTFWLFAVALGTRTPEALFLPMAIIALPSFPLGPLAAIVVVLLGDALGVDVRDGLEDPMMGVLWVWLFLYGWGYLQWFILLPALRRWIRQARRP